MKKVSRRQVKADRLRQKYKNYCYGIWTVENMSDNQVIKILGRKENEKERSN